MLTVLAIALQAPNARTILPNVLMIASFIAIFYFLLIRPQRKMQQQHRDLISNLKKGDEIMTEGGIIGQVVHLSEDRLTVKTAENTRIVVSRQKIARVMTADSPAGETKA
ncbi:MAG: preprotein translocase subunit YajC [Gemmatimonadota bacterium]